ncbi:hypothetical protein OAS31_01555 [Desulfobacterota bacterium]|mgnify:FL=1|nr:hypothetical protein [Thermodesulfobacteriota bacterium]NSX00741.1 hypothetical protein [bacterium]|tara:strand:+ start:2483 stop:3088 length:606 start_codon:yes stop_codon:yes gene_type:complete
MKKTTIKISVTQDGLLPEEVTLLGKIFIPPIQKQILRSTGFEKIDDSTYAGVMPVKIIANAKVQEIEFEIGAIPDFRKKVVEFVNVVSLQDFIEPEPEPVAEPKKKLSKSKKEKEEKKEAAKAKAKAKKIVGTSPLKSKAKKAATKKAVAKANIAKKAAAKKSLTKKVVKKAAVKASAKKVTAKKAAPKKVTKVKNKTKRK